MSIMILLPHRFYEPKVYKVAQEVGVLDKILLGSDYPLLSPQRNLEEMTRSG